MEKLVIYASKKGSTETYANAFANKKGYPIVSEEKVSSENLVDVERIYYFGSVYAGRVIGLNSLKKKLMKEIPVTIISVGLTSNKDQAKLSEIQEGIVNEFPHADLIHLRGRLAKAEMKLPEKLLLKVISKSGSEKADNAKTDLDRAIAQVVSTGSADYIDLTELDRIQ